MHWNKNRIVQDFDTTSEYSVVIEKKEKNFKRQRLSLYMCSDSLFFKN